VVGEVLQPRHGSDDEHRRTAARDAVEAEGLQVDDFAALGEGAPLPGILPEGRAAKPTARAALAAFDGLSVSYTNNGLVLDRLSQVQRVILALLNIPLPWPESGEE